jgi:hypothetical protein
MGHQYFRMLRRVWVVISQAGRGLYYKIRLMKINWQTWTSCERAGSAAVRLYTCIREVPGTNLSGNILYHDWGTWTFSSVSSRKCQDFTSIMPRPVPSKTLTIHHSPVVLSLTLGNLKKTVVKQKSKEFFHVADFFIDTVALSHRCFRNKLCPYWLITKNYKRRLRITPLQKNYFRSKTTKIP